VIKKRTPQPENAATEEQIEAFAAGAHSPAATAPVAPAAPKGRAKASRSLLVEFEKHPDVSQQLADVANHLDRSKQWVAIKALTIGLEELAKRDD
jgi:hypothetical protein